jgi:hypothetical protein
MQRLYDDSCRQDHRGLLNEISLVSFLRPRPRQVCKQLLTPVYAANLILVDVRCSSRARPDNS